MRIERRLLSIKRLVNRQMTFAIAVVILLIAATQQSESADMSDGHLVVAGVNASSSIVSPDDHPTPRSQHLKTDTGLDVGPF